MKKLYTLLPLFGSVFFCLSVNAQVLFFEDFDGIPGPTAGGAGTYTFAPGFLLRNVDNGTPDAQVAYVNEAWERREDFNFNVADSGAFSTSYISPVVASNDWMWTPAIGPLPANAQLSWNAVTYDPNYRDGYEVRIMVAPTVPTGGTGTIGNQITNSTVVFSTPAENAAWTPHTVPLNTYTGQTVYIGFRNNSTDKFLLVVDDIKVEVLLNYDAQVLNMDTLTEYLQIPRSQTQPLIFESDIRNNGLLPMTGVTLTAKVYNQSNVEVYSAASNVQPTLAAGATSHFVVAGWTPPANEDVYTVKLYADANETDQLNGNDTATATVTISETTYARDNGAVAGALGIGAGNGGYLGQDFLMVNPGRIPSIGIYYTRGYTGKRYAAAIWDMAGGVPNQIVAVTDTLLYPDDSADFYVLPIHNGPFTFTPGRYVVTAIEFDSTLSVGQTSALFTNDRTWVDWPTNPNPGWSNNEDFGGGFSKSYIIRPSVLPLCPAALVTNASVMDAACGGSDGGVDLTVLPGTYTYLWSNNDTTADLANVAAGNYSVTVTNTDLLCSQTLNYSISTVNGPSLVAIDGSSVDCFGDEGTASVQISGGTAPFTYQWSNGDSTATISSMAGSYTVTVTDDNGCVLSAGPVDITEPSQLTATGSATPADCFGNEGTASVTAGGGTTPYTYLWSNGDNTAAISDVAGTYTVTVTDDNGCEVTSAAIVITEPVAVAGTIASTPATCPTCTDGMATVTPTGGVPPYTYAWSPSGGSAATATGLAAGTYTVTITDNSGCTGTANVTVTAINNASITENGADGGIQAFPNPSHGVFYVTANIDHSGEALVEILDISGRVVYTKNVVMNNALSNTGIHLEYAAPGTYVLRFTAGQKQFFRKLVIE